MLSSSPPCPRRCCRRRRPCPTRCCRRLRRCPTRCCHRSVVPHTMLSQSAPPQSLPHTMLSSPPVLPHTMLSSPPSCPRRCCRRRWCPRRCCRRSVVGAPHDVVAAATRCAAMTMLSPDVLPVALRAPARRSPRRCRRLQDAAGQAVVAPEIWRLHVSDRIRLAGCARREELRETNGAERVQEACALLEAGCSRGTPARCTAGSP